MPFRRSSSQVLQQPSFWRLLVHLPKLLKLVFRLLKDGRVPLLGKLAFAAALGYVIWPLDLIPDFALPLLGQLDDLAVLLAGMRYLLRQTPPPILEEHLARIQ